MDLSLWITILIVALIFAAYQFWSEEVKSGEKFSAIIMPDGTLGALTIYDVTGAIMYSTGDDSLKGKRAEIYIAGGANAFCISRNSDGKIIGVGPFTDINNDIVDKVMGKKSENYTLYTDPALIATRR